MKLFWCALFVTMVIASYPNSCYDAWMEIAKEPDLDKNSPMAEARFMIAKVVELSNTFPMKRLSCERLFSTCEQLAPGRCHGEFFLNMLQ